MAKKKREHIVFDQMLKTKKNIPFSKVNKQSIKKNEVWGRNERNYGKKRVEE